MNLFRSIFLVSISLFLANQTTAQQKFSILHKTGNFVPPANAEEVLQRNVPVQALADGWRHQLVQFSELPNAAERLALEATGIRFVEYLPHNAYIVAFPEGYDPAQLRQANIRSVLDLRPEWKIDPKLSELPLPEWTFMPNGEATVTVTWFPQFDAYQAAKLIGSPFVGAGEISVNHYARTMVLVIPAERIPELARRPAVQYIEPIDPDPQPENYSGRSLHRSTAIATEASYAGGRKYDGSGVVVAMGDDGPIGPHIDYHGRTNQSFVSANNGNHGDHVAGTIMGSGNLNPKHKGMAYGATLHVYSVWDAVNSSPSSHVNDKVMITSTSYSNGCNAGYTSFARTADQQTRLNPSLLHVFSAGNNGTSDCNYGAGANWGNVTGGVKVGKNVLAVANVNFSGQVVSSSSRGPAKDGRIKPEVGAKGTDVTSPVDDDQYASFTGTSMSCPGVSGTTAQLYHAFRTLNSGSDPESALIKGILMNSADDGGKPGPDFKYGYGVINALAAVKNLEDGRYLSGQVDQGDTATHTINVPSGTAAIKIMVNWTDFEGSAGSSIALVNNLDMQVTDPSQTVYDPWVLDHTPIVALLDAPATRGVDNLNNMEQVTLDTPQPGAYQVMIVGKTVPQGPQKYFITYEIIDSSVTLTYPFGGEPFVPNETETIRWDCFGDWGTFDADYSLDSGQTWTSIFTAAPGAARQYNWKVPVAATGNARLRITRGNDSDMGESTFSIISVPAGLKVLRSCPGYLVLKWNHVGAATSYEVSTLGSTYMDSIGSTVADTFVVSGTNPYDTYYFSVKALGPDMAVGRRAIAVKKLPGIENCLEPDDIEVVQVVSPGNGTIQECTNPTDLPIKLELLNKSPNDLTNFTLSYKFDGGSTVTETYTDTLPGYGSDIYTFTGSTIALTIGNHNIVGWASNPGDVNSSNDTVSASNAVANNTTLSTLPFTEDFETFSNCPTFQNCGNTSCPMANGWYNEINNSGDQIDWRTNIGSTPSSGTGPKEDHNPGNVFGHYLYLEGSQCYGREAVLISPCIDLSTAKEPELSFWFHLYGQDMGELHVDVYAKGLWHEDATAPMVADWSDSWWDRQLDLTQFAGEVINIRWRGITGDDDLSDMALDDISVIDKFVAVEEALSTGEVKVYPNPGSGLYNISIDNLQTFSALELKVTDLQGRVVFTQQTTTSAGIYKGQLNLSTLPSGIYSLQVLSKGKRYQAKLSKI